MALLSSAGCRSVLTHFIASTPNRFHPLAGEVNLSYVSHRLHGVDEQFWVEVGPPCARLLVSVVEPCESFACPRGTVLVVHGIYADSSSMLGKARDLAQAGYRAVLVDLRGHGQSSGRWLTFGLRESRDLSQVIDELAARRIWTGKLGVLGISYGATTSIHLAGRDPRIAAVVAIAPFNSMREEVPHFAHQVIPFSRRLMADETVQEAIDRAASKGDFNPDLAVAGMAIQQTVAPVLILQGTSDKVVPPRNARELAWAGAGHTRLIMLPDLGHTGIWFDHDDEVKQWSRIWFDQYLAL